MIYSLQDLNGIQSVSFCGIPLLEITTRIIAGWASAVECTCFRILCDFTGRSRQQSRKLRLDRVPCLGVKVQLSRAWRANHKPRKQRDVVF